jgi:putative membrane protein
LRPFMICCTLPITLLSLGLSLLIINGIMLWLVASLVPGFYIANFGTAVLAGLFVTVLSWLIGAVLGSLFPPHHHHHRGTPLFGHD